MNYRALHHDLYADQAWQPIKRTVSADAPYSVFTKREKWSIVILVAIAGMASPMTGNVFLPAVPEIARDLNTSNQAILLSVTVYMIAQGISPTPWSAMCDVLGRRLTYLGTFTLYVAASVALSFTPNYAFLVVFRFIQAAGSASVIAVGAGTIGDISTPNERGLYMSLFQIGPMVGPAVSPVASGFLSQAYGWRSIFYMLAVYGFILLAILALFMPETLRSIVGNGSITPPPINRSFVSLFKTRHEVDPPQPEDLPPKKTWRDIDLLGPFKVFREIDCFCLLTFNSIVYAAYYCVTTSISTILKRQYNLSEGIIGLSYLPIGVGSLIATLITGPIMNHDYRVTEREVIKKEGDQYNDLSKDEKWAVFPIEHARLRPLRAPFVLLIATMIAYGWALQADAPLAVPLVLQAIIGFLIMFPLTSTSTMIVDLFPEARASATAANNLYRCLIGAGGTAVIDPMLTNLGPGRAFTLVAGINLAFVPLPIYLWICGHRHRTARAERIKARKQAKARDSEKACASKARPAPNSEEASHDFDANEDLRCTQDKVVEHHDKPKDEEALVKGEHTNR